MGNDSDFRGGMNHDSSLKTTKGDSSLVAIGSWQKNVHIKVRGGMIHGS